MEEKHRRTVSINSIQSIELMVEQLEQKMSRKLDDKFDKILSLMEYHYKVKSENLESYQPDYINDAEINKNQLRHPQGT